MERVIFSFTIAICLLFSVCISIDLIIIVYVTNCTFQYFYIIKNSFVAFLLLTKLFLSAPIKRFNYCIANSPLSTSSPLSLHPFPLNCLSLSLYSFNCVKNIASLICTLLSRNHFRFLIFCKIFGCPFVWYFMVHWITLLSFKSNYYKYTILLLFKIYILHMNKTTFL